MRSVKILVLLDDISSKSFPFWVCRHIASSDHLDKDVDDALFVEPMLPKTVPISHLILIYAYIPSLEILVITLYAINHDIFHECDNTEIGKYGLRKHGYTRTQVDGTRQKRFKTGSGRVSG